MAIIFIPTPMRKFAGDKASVEVEASTVGGAVAALVVAHPEFGKNLLDANGALRKFVRLYVGDTDVQDLRGDDTPVDAHTTISIIPAIAGG